MIEDVDGCTGPETVGDDWMFCNPRTTEVAPREHCRCKKTWQDDVVCPGKTQYGCSKDCDDDPDAWCIVENPGCIEEEDKDGGGWAYCEIGGGLLQKEESGKSSNLRAGRKKKKKEMSFLEEMEHASVKSRECGGGKFRLLKGAGSVNKRADGATSLSNVECANGYCHIFGSKSGIGKCKTAKASDALHSTKCSSDCAECRHEDKNFCVRCKQRGAALLDGKCMKDGCPKDTHFETELGDCFKKRSEHGPCKTSAECASGVCNKELHAFGVCDRPAPTTASLLQESAAHKLQREQMKMRLERFESIRFCLGAKGNFWETHSTGLGIKKFASKSTRRDRDQSVRQLSLPYLMQSRILLKTLV